MANLKEIRVRIASVKSTRQITSAMKMVSAAKLRKAQDAVLQMRPYAKKLKHIQDDLCKSIDHDVFIPLKEEREVKSAIFVIITSNKGLCGAFNGSVVKEAMRTIEENENYQKLYNQGNLQLYCIGKKGIDLLKAKKYNIAGNYNQLFDDLNYNTVAKLGSEFIKLFLEKEVDEIVLFYNQFKNAAMQILTTEKLLPVENEKPCKTDMLTTNSDYILEPSKEGIVQKVLPKLVKVNLFKALLDSQASEHGARMTAMHKATDNATDLIKQLQLDYNKARQASITNEISEIVGGAEALKG